MEVWDILDRNGRPTGKKVERKHVCLANGEYHLVVHIWVLGADGRVLIQQRSFNKALMPGEWAAIGGSVISGEDSLTAARRELFEEMGIETEDGDMQLIRKMVRKNSILDIYLVCKSPSIYDLTLQQQEVNTAKWVHRNKLRQMIKNGEFHDYGKEYFNTVFGAFASKSKLKRRIKNERRIQKRIK